MDTPQRVARVRLRNLITIVTHDGGKPASAARVPQEDGESEGAEREDQGEQEDIGHGVGDAVVVAGRPGEVPAQVATLVLGQTARTHRHLVLVRDAVFGQSSL